MGASFSVSTRLVFVTASDNDWAQTPGVYDRHRISTAEPAVDVFRDGTSTVTNGAR